MEIRHNKFYQFLFDYSLGIRISVIPKFRSIAFRIYNFIVKLQRKRNKNDIYVKFKQREKILWINTTHRLPFTLTYHKLYSANLPRICKCIADEIPDARMIDIGANIGDTVFLIRQRVNIPILCVEGNIEYIPLLQKNISLYDNVEIEEHFVGGQEDTLMAAEVFSDGGGTSYVVKKKFEGISITNRLFKSLPEIVSSHDRFRSSKILKIDTDGYDCEILRKNMDFLDSVRPVIFFEYAPAWLPNGKNSELITFELLKSIGYCYFLFYNGDGELLSFSGLGDPDSILSVHEYLSRGRRFGDIMVVHNSDKRLFDIIKNSELEYMKSYFEK